MKDRIEELKEHIEAMIMSPDTPYQKKMSIIGGMIRNELKQQREKYYKKGDDYFLDGYIEGYEDGLMGAYDNARQEIVEMLMKEDWHGCHICGGSEPVLDQAITKIKEMDA